MATKAIGIDIGGTGIKGGLVDLSTGSMASDRIRIDTPQPATPEAVAETVAEILATADWDGPVGCALPGVVQRGVVRTAANIDESWIGTDAQDLFGRVTGREVSLLNDADAAGLAEVAFGAAQEQGGTVIMVTLGTGIGSALFHDGVLVPNAELGHLMMGKKSAERRMSATARKARGLDWQDWAEELSEYFGYVESLLWPELFVVGGGVSKKSELWLPHITARTPIVVAELRNNAGIVGAACAVPEHQR